jgi:hypothetical protein
MSDLPPPPLEHPGAPTPKPLTGTPRRPGPVTGAAAVLMAAGLLSLVAWLLWASGDRVDVDLPFLEGELERIAALGLVVQGGLALLAGWLVLRLRPTGRVLGIVLSSLAIVAGVTQLRSAGSSGLLGLVLHAFVLYTLIAYGFVFKTGQPSR